MRTLTDDLIGIVKAVVFLLLLVGVALVEFVEL